MLLILNGSSMGIAQLGPDFLILHEAREHPPADAEIILTVDGHEERWAVRLSEGLRSGDKLVPISTVFWLQEQFDLRQSD